jgi:hypothetical protein
MYFQNVPDSELKKALIDKDFLDYRRYTTFINDRSEKILKKVKDKLDFWDDNFEED